MDKAITTALLIVVGMMMALMLFNTAYPAVLEGGNAITSMARRADQQMRSQISIIHAASELDGSGWWQDTNGNGQFEVFIWVKNIGATRINPIESLDVFFGPEGNFTRVPHESQAGGSFPNWSANLENGTEWSPTTTLRIAVHYALPLGTGRYYAKVITPSGVDAEYFMGM